MRRSAVVLLVLPSLIAALYSEATLTAQDVSAGAVPSEWTTQGPNGGFVNALVADPSNPRIVYAATQGGGVFKSTDGGATWAARSTGLTNRFNASMEVNGIAVVSETLLYAATNGGVHTSGDAGATWTLTTSGIETWSVRAVTVSPDNPSVLYAATNRGVYKSTNGAASWQLSNAGITTEQIRALSIDSTNSSNILAGTGGAGVFRSTDAGATWAPASGTAERFTNVFVRDAANPAIALVGTDKGVFRTIDGGATWIASSSGLPDAPDVRALAADPVNPSNLHLGLSGGAVHVSVDGGVSWDASGTPTVPVFISALLRTSDNAILAGTSSGVFESVDGAQTWAPANTGLSNSSIVDVDAALDGTVYGASRTGVFLAQDNGRAWVRRSDGLAGSIVAVGVAPSKSSVLYAGTVTSVNFTNTYHLYKSTNSGLSWFEKSTGLPNNEIRAIAVDPTDPDTAYVAV